MCRAKCNTPEIDVNGTALAKYGIISRVSAEGVSVLTRIYADVTIQTAETTTERSQLLPDSQYLCDCWVSTCRVYLVKMSR